MKAHPPIPQVWGKGRCLRLYGCYILIAHDPPALEARLNLYAYAGNNPVMKIDPSGLSFNGGGMISMNDDMLSKAWVNNLNNIDFNRTQMSFERAASNYLSASSTANSYSSSGDMLAASRIRPGQNPALMQWDGLVGGAGGAYRPGSLQSNVSSLRGAQNSNFEQINQGASTSFNYASQWTKRSSTQIEINLSQSKAIANLEANGFTKTLSKDGTVSILQNGNQTYRFYPQATSTGGPSAKLSIEGVKRPVATLRFPRP